MTRFARPVIVVASFLVVVLVVAARMSPSGLAQETGDVAWASDPQLVERGQTIYRGPCRDCHGRRGELEALGQSRRLADLGAAEVVEALTTLRDAGDLSAMQNRIKSSLTDDDIRALAAYIATFGDGPLQ